MKLIRIITACLLILSVSACGGLTKKETNAWLDEKSGLVSVDLTGTWDAGGSWSGGWGDANLVQEGKHFSGTLGLYYVDGAVNGDNIYMVIFSGRKVYYTAQMKKNGRDLYTGKAVYRVIIGRPGSENAESYLITLKRK